MRPTTPNQWKIPYELSSEPLPGSITGLGGAAVICQAFRSMQLPGACEANLAATRKIELGFTAGEMVETGVIGVLLGADSVEDLKRLHDDEAVTKILGYRTCSARSFRDWLEKSHDEAAVVQARAQAAELDLKSSVPALSRGLTGLQAVLGVSAREAAKRLPAGAGSHATVDLDATIIESDKRAATWTYDGVKGYQPVVAVWAEAAVVLATEFRDGNVPAAKDPLTCAQRAFAELPKEIEQRAFRGDSACDHGELLTWLDDERRANGPAGKIAYAISARMVPDLAKASRSVPDAQWQTFGRDTDGTLRQWADLDYVPALPTETKDAQPRRYVGLRFLKPQGELFDDGHDRKHFAVVTNRTERGDRVIEWHRQKAGTVEHTHDDLKNALAAGRMPSQKFGANAAWFTINAVAYNVAAALRAAAPTPELRAARIKTLRFEFLMASARLTRFSRKITLRFVAPQAWVARVIRLLSAFPCRVQPTG